MTHIKQQHFFIAESAVDIMRIVYYITSIIFIDDDSFDVGDSFDVIYVGGN